MSSFDLNAAVDEAAGKKKPPFTFHWGEGDDRQDFSIDDTGDIRWALSMQGRNVYKTLVHLLGQENFDRLDSVDQPFTEKHAAALIQAYVDHVGESAGKALPRSKRSKSTVVR